MGTVMVTTDIAVDAAIITVGAEGVVIITDGTEAVVTVTGRPLLEGAPAGPFPDSAENAQNKTGGNSPG